MSDFGQLPEIPFDPTVSGPFDIHRQECAEDEFFNVSTLTCEPLPGPGGPFPTVPIPMRPCGQQLADMEMNLFACEARVVTYAVVAAGAGILAGVMLGRLL
jgi:hypothetical protein